VVSYGGGVDSTAILVEFARLHAEWMDLHPGAAPEDSPWRPDMIIHSDVGEGCEHPKLYETLPVIDEWLESVGFPKLTIVSKYSPTTRYRGLLNLCWCNTTMPSLAFGKHSCSLKFKIDSIDDFVWGVRGWEPAFEALAKGNKVIRVIGYDSGKSDCKRFAKMDKVAAKDEAAGKWSPWKNWYPLQDWGWKRAQCVAAIEGCQGLADRLEMAIGQRCVRKSSCWFCPAMKRDEVEKMGREYPELALKAAALEHRAMTGKHGFETVNGLGLGSPRTEYEKRIMLDGRKRRNWSWTTFLMERHILPADWYSRAVEAGLIPSDWDEFSERCRPIREDISRRKRRVQKAAEAIVVDEYRLKALKGSEKVKKTLDNLPECLEWSTERHELKGAQSLLKTLVPSDWANVPKPKEAPADRAARKAARIRWQKACEEAQRIEAARAEAPEPEQNLEPEIEACVVAPAVDDAWIVYDGYNRHYLHIGDNRVSNPVAALKMTYDDAVRAARGITPRPDDAILIRDPRGPREKMVWYDPELPGWPLPNDDDDDL
jgi:hypothetical protein